MTTADSQASGTTVAAAAAKIVARAISALGTPYVYGVTDCEWLTRFCASAAGFTIPWGATEQYDDPALPHVTPPLEPGDFVYFHDVGDPPGEDHCGVVIRPGLMIDAPYTGVDVRYDPFSTTEQLGVLQYRGALRVALLATSTAPPPSPAPLPPPATLVNVQIRVLSEGCKGYDVRTLQWVLNGWNGIGLVIDADFGPLTKEAVVTFQKRLGYTMDGVVGAQTWRGLLGAPNP
jgi:peptidoglycan hydrolase-like protein with peptidoglycan-binding domain